MILNPCKNAYTTLYSTTRITWRPWCLPPFFFVPQQHLYFHWSICPIYFVQQSIPSPEKLLKHIEEVIQELLNVYMPYRGPWDISFKKGVKDTSYSKVVTRCSLIVRPYPTTSPGSKIDHEWLRPFSLSWCIQTLAYHLTFFLSVEGVHQLIQVSLLQNHKMIQIRDREIILLT